MENDRRVLGHAGRLAHAFSVLARAIREITELASQQLDLLLVFRDSFPQEEAVVGSDPQARANRIDMGEDAVDQTQAIAIFPQKAENLIGIARERFKSRSRVGQLARAAQLGRLPETRFSRAPLADAGLMPYSRKLLRSSSRNS